MNYSLDLYNKQQLILAITAAFIEKTDTNTIQTENINNDQKWDSLTAVADYP